MYYTLTRHYDNFTLFRSNGYKSLVTEWIDGVGKLYTPKNTRGYVPHKSKISAIMNLFKVHPQAQFVGRADFRGEYSWKI